MRIKDIVIGETYRKKDTRYYAEPLQGKDLDQIF